MKNYLIRICCILLVVAAFGCYNLVTADRLEAETQAQSETTEAARGAENPAQEGAGFKDGQYEGSAQGYGGTITVLVTIENGSIKEIDPIAHDGEDAAYWASCSGVIPQLIESQGAHADTVSGATFSSSGIINATIEALSKAL